MAEPRPTARTPFFEFQARNRRATWRLTLACALVVGGCGFVSAIGFAVNVFLVLFAMVFIPAVLCLGVGALFLLTPATSGLSHAIWLAAGVRHTLPAIGREVAEGLEPEGARPERRAGKRCRGGFQVIAPSSRGDLDRCGSSKASIDAIDHAMPM